MVYVFIRTNVDRCSQGTKTSTENHSDPLTSSEGISVTPLDLAIASVAVGCCRHSNQVIIVRSRIYGSYIWHRSTSICGRHNIFDAMWCQSCRS